MPAKHSRCLVIDASILRSAGDLTATDPVAQVCRDVLQTILLVCHRMVLTTEITDEWNRHQSAFARRWRIQMIARKKVCAVAGLTDLTLRGKIENSTTDKHHQAMMDKDCHLLEAALAADKIVLSRDETVRGLFYQAAIRVGELRAVHWANPTKTADHCLSWLEAGAPDDEARRLGRS